MLRNIRLGAFTTAILLSGTLVSWAQGPDPCLWPGFFCALPCETDSHDTGYWPISGYIYADKMTEAFGPRLRENGNWDYHEGIDIRTWVNGQGASKPVHAPWTGWVHAVDVVEGTVILRNARLRADVNESTIFTGYYHLNNQDGLLSGLRPDAEISMGSHFVNSGNTGAPYHLHFATMLGCSDVRRCAVNPIRLHSLFHLHTGHPEVYFERLYEQNADVKMTFSVFNRAQPTDQDECLAGCDENLHFNRVRIKAPDAPLLEAVGLSADELVVDFDRRINDDSQVVGGGGPGRVGDENGTVVTQTSFGSPTTLRIAPEYFDSRENNYQVVKFTLTVPDAWKHPVFDPDTLQCKQYTEMIQIVACDTAAGEEDCSEHCNTDWTVGPIGLGKGSETTVLAQASAADCETPVVITNPADGSLVRAGQSLAVDVEALGTVPVVLEILKDGVLVETLSPVNGGSPWRFDWRVPGSAATVAYTLRAYVLGNGNRVPSGDVAITAIGTDEKLVSFVRPPDGATVRLGSDVTVQVEAPSNSDWVYLTVNGGGSMTLSETAKGSGIWTTHIVARERTNILRAVAHIPGLDPEEDQITVYADETSPFIQVLFSRFDQAGVSIPANDPVLKPGIDVQVLVFLNYEGVATPSLVLRIQKPDGSFLPSKSPAPGCPDISKTCIFTWRGAEQAEGTYVLEVEATSGGSLASAVLSVRLDPNAREDTTVINDHAFLRKLKKLQGVWYNRNGFSYPTGIRTDRYACSVVGLAARRGDIDEDYAGDIFQMYLYPRQGSWELRGDFRSGCYGGLFSSCNGGIDEDEEIWDVDLLCVSTEVASIDGPQPTKSFFLQSFNGLGDDVHRDTGISSSEYACGVGGFAARDGDINEDDVRDIVQTYLYRGGNGNWHIRADFTTHHDSESWDVNLVCASNEIASSNGPQPGKPVFLKTLPPLGDNPNVNTGVSSEEYACGVVGFAARDGDIDENESRNRPLILSYVYPNQGTWYFRGDFRTHHNHENWTDVTLLCLARQGRAARPPVLWSYGYGGARADMGESVAIDGEGNVLLAGFFSETARFYNWDLHSAGGQDAFLAKVTGRHGRYLWAKSFGGVSDDIGFRLALDRNNEVAMAGWFQGSANFGTGNLVSAGSWDTFLGKYTTAGQPLWTTRFGGPGIDGIWDLSTDGSGHFLTTGYFEGTARFADGVALSSAGAEDAWVGAFHGITGARSLSARFGGPGRDMGRAIEVGGSGDLFTTAMFSEGMDFGGGVLVNAGGQDMAVARLDAASGHVWSAGFGGGGTDQPWDEAVDSTGSVFVVGGFTGTASLGTGSLVSAGGEDIFLAKYSGDGAPIWSKRIGGSGQDRAYAVSVDGSGNVLLTGFFEGEVDSDGGRWTSAGGRDVFVASYSGRSGYPLWSTTLGGAGNDNGLDLATGGPDVVVTGFFEGEANFGKTLHSAGQTDTFLVKFGPMSSRPPVFDAFSEWEVLAPFDLLVVEIAATDPDNDGIEIRASGLPNGARFGNQGVVSGIGHVEERLFWSPTQADLGMHVVAFTVTDEFGRSATRYLNILVCDPLNCQFLP